MKGFLAGVVVTILMIAVFPQLGHWVTALPYGTFAAWSPAADGTPAAWQGGGRGGRMGGGPRAFPAGY